MSRFVLEDREYYTVAPHSDIPIVEGGLASVKKIDVYYIDINRAYKENLKGIILYDEDVINGEIANILATPLGSDQFEPTFGSNVPYRLMDPINDITAWLLYTDTIGALNTWMVQKGVITLVNPSSYIVPIDGNPDREGYEINMVYRNNMTKVLTSFHSFILR